MFRDIERGTWAGVALGGTVLLLCGGLPVWLVYAVLRAVRSTGHSWLPTGLEHLTAGSDRLGPYLREGDHARRRACVHPAVDGAPLHQYVASLRCTLVPSSSMSISPEITVP